MRVARGLPSLLALFVFACLLFSKLSLAAASSSHELAKEWLQRMMDASQTLSYQGTFAYIKGSDVDVMRIVNSNDSRGKGQRMYSLTGPTREIVVADDSVMCLLPKQQVALNKSGNNRSPFPISLPHDLETLESSYSFSMLGDDRVAGMKTRIIAINPKDSLRYGYRLWLESESGMVLRSALIGMQGEILEQLLFTDISISQEIDISLLAPKFMATSAPGIPTPEESSEVGESAWKISTLPPGFFKLSHSFFPDASSTYPTEHIVFSDGLATVSVFVERPGENSVLLEGATQMGLMNAYGIVLDGFQLVSVGEVPVETVELIAMSIQYNPQK